MKVGDRVRLVAIFDQPEAYGVIIGMQICGMITVLLDEEYRDGESEDGLCEVEGQFVEVVK